MDILDKRFFNLPYQGELLCNILQKRQGHASIQFFFAVATKNHSDGPAFFCFGASKNLQSDIVIHQSEITKPVKSNVGSAQRLDSLKDTSGR